MKASRQTVSKVNFLHSKLSYTRITLAIPKFERKKAFARFHKKIRRVDLANVDKLAKNNKDVKFLPGRQDFIDRTADAKGMNAKDSKEAVRKLLNMITKKNRPMTISAEKGGEFKGEFKKVYSAERTQIYSTKNGTMAAFAERKKDRP